MTDVLLIVAGLILLALGGEGLVRGSVIVAARMRLSTLLISAVIIGFGTSMPELLVSVGAALRGSPDIALGNVVGSNICNVLLILGVASLITAIPCKTGQIRRGVMTGVAVSLFLALLSFGGLVTRIMGLAMALLLAAYVSYSIRGERELERKRREHVEEETLDGGASVPVVVLVIAASLALLLAGAHLLIDGATSVALRFGVSEAVIGLTIVALGTSLPELVTACIAAWKKDTDIVIGNILGSNLFNILGILGTTAILRPIPFAGRIASQDVWVMLAASALLVPVSLSNRKIGRVEGCVFLLLYGGYIAWLYRLS